MELQGKTAIITGAASGFGREFAVLCAAEGMNLVLADLDVAGLAATKDLVAATGVGILTVPTNVAKPEQVEALAEQTWERFGGGHLLFNNAGVAAAGPVWSATLEDWKWVLDVNLMGVVHGIRSFVPRMIAQGGPAHVVNTASVAGLVSPPGMSVYCVSKHAVVTLSECLYHDLRLAGTKIGVSVLCPGFVKTGIAESHRNRPAELRATNPMAPVYGEKIRQVIEASTITARDIAEQTIAAVIEDRFYIVTHPESDCGVSARLTGILQRDAPKMPQIA
ncbi:SDR family NAD(P)-dependent oxidoreductase [Magnetospirillum fulvum]|uniref:NADP-dependent 3-hydroxy acid dehydrogenase YdfG n=1 Tax=Magnetospirillum fulvum TaxID=1082 RepID=A0A1H6IX33_MAGFU|nr:SDR family NAD(P)-dependent oxidoreductase [Magnetospirillum fulvum]SEH53959.1 NADP-dependent 3-hydroxy acid dehydrogenase YdfG [Magnetospirillum fulvum]